MKIILYGFVSTYLSPDVLLLSFLIELLIQTKVDSSINQNSGHSNVSGVYCKCGWSHSNNLYLNFIVKYRQIKYKTIQTIRDNGRTCMYIRQ